MSGVRPRRGRAEHETGPGFDLVASKLRRPAVRSGTVRRSALIEKLAREDARPIVSVAAPAGYGKSTVLSQWAEQDTRPFVWLSLVETDNNPRRLRQRLTALTWLR